MRLSFAELWMPSDRFTADNSCQSALDRFRVGIGALKHL